MGFWGVIGFITLGYYNPLGYWGPWGVFGFIGVPNGCWGHSPGHHAGPIPVGFWDPLMNFLDFWGSNSGHLVWQVWGCSSGVFGISDRILGSLMGF